MLFPIFGFHCGGTLKPNHPLQSLCINYIYTSWPRWLLLHIWLPCCGTKGPSHHLRGISCINYVYTKAVHHDFFSFVGPRWWNCKAQSPAAKLMYTLSWPRRLLLHSWLPMW